MEMERLASSPTVSTTAIRRIQPVKLRIEDAAVVEGNKGSALAGSDHGTIVLTGPPGAS
jgi:hypothetical protein